MVGLHMPALCQILARCYHNRTYSPLQDMRDIHTERRPDGRRSTLAQQGVVLTKSYSFPAALAISIADSRR